VSERTQPPGGGTAIEFLTAPQDSSFPSEWYSLSGTDHFWFRWRLAASLRLARDAGIPIRQPLRCLEIGSGSGILRDQLEAETDWTIDITDLNLEALRRAGEGRGRTLYYDVRQESLGPAYDLVLAFDVIEHLSAVGPFLSSASRHLKPGGMLLLNVPALQSLYSAYDENVGHERRYNRGSLAKEIEGLDLDPLEVRFWGLSLVPLLVLRKALLAIRRRPAEEVIRQGFRPPGSLANSLLSGLGRLELAVLGGRPPLGTSVLLAARRR
jgi:SAM-dependent methyltransferase